MNITAQLRRIMSRRNAWRDVFRSEDGELKKSGIEVLADLQRFCHDSRPTVKVSKSTGMIDPYAMAIAEGRREVFLRIKEYLKLDDRDLQRLLKQQNNEVYE
jgi:hypothetical protein